MKNDKSPYLPLLVSGIAVILFSTAGFARMMGWGPTSTGGSGDVLALDQADPAPMASTAYARARCAECGEIVSMQKIERHDDDSGSGATSGAAGDNRDRSGVKSTGSHEIVVRMADGSSRVIDYAGPVRWRTGERLIVIGGTDPSYP